MKTLSLFSGAGGFDCGFTAGGFQIHAAVEADKACVATLRLNMPHTCIHAGPIQDYDPVENFDAIIAGPPCQGFSMLGRRDVHDPRNQLLNEIVRIAATANPRLVIVENVLGITTLQASKTLTFADRFERNLRAQDYNTTRWTLDASVYGVPQTRMRTFLIGVRARACPSPPIADLLPMPIKAVLTPPEPEALLVRRGQPRMRRNPVSSLDRPMGTLTTTEQWAWAHGEYHATRVNGLWQNIAERFTPLTNSEYARLQTFPAHWQFAGKPSVVRRQIGNAVPPAFAMRIATHLYAWLNAQPNEKTDHLAVAGS